MILVARHQPQDVFWVFGFYDWMCFKDDLSFH